MKPHTSRFKEEVKNFGRQIDSIITYEIDGETVELGNVSLNSITPHYEGSILKSVMKQLDIDSNVEIPIGTEINYQFGVMVDGSYEYLNFGNYIVKEIEKQEAKESYLIKCYDKMLYSMKDYENMNITYPITVRDYINTICNHLNISFANIEDNFANFDKVIQNELYLDTEGRSLNYTFRDVLDELAEVTASTIVINENDELEIRYLNNTEDTINEEYFKNINVNFGEMYGPVNTIVLSRSAGADKISISTSEDIPDDEKIAIEISDNQIMNFDDRDSYMQEILSQLAGLQYYINDFSSTGICYYDICDMYNVQIGENTYNCIMFNDEINITQGLEENIHTKMPDASEQEYKYMDTTDQRLQKVTLIVRKQEGEIEGLITDTTNTDDPNTTAGKLSRVRQDVDSLTSIFQITGGSNMIKNSQFLLSDKTWLFENNGSNSYHTELGDGYDSSLIGTTVSYGKIDLRNIILSSSITSDENGHIPNINDLIVGQTYTLNFLFSQDATTTTKFSLMTGNNIIWETENFTGEKNMEEVVFTFNATASVYIFKVETSTNSTDTEQGHLFIYDLMLNSGDKKPWEPAQSEIASTVLQMSKEGLTVKSTGAETTTLLNTDGINIYEGEIISESTKITSFNKKGIVTRVAQTTETDIGRYIMKTLNINNTQHHVEYFGGSD